MGSIPSGFIQLPLWVLVLIWGLVVGFIGYIWNSLSKRVAELERSEKDKIGARTNDPAWIKQENRLSQLEKDELERLRAQSLDPSLTFEKHMKLCSAVTQTFKEFVSQAIAGLEKRLDELKNDALKDIQEVREGQNKIHERIDDLIKLNGGKQKD